MSKQIQDTYPRGQLKGQIGMINRTNAPFKSDRIRIGAAGLRPGDAFTMDANGDAIPLASATEAVKVRGVLSYPLAGINDYTTGALPDYSVGDWIQEVLEGYVVVQAGEAIKKGQGVMVDPATHKWVVADTAGQLKVMTAAHDVEADGLFDVEIGAELTATA